MRSKRLKRFCLSFFLSPIFFTMAPVGGPYHSRLRKRRVVALRH